MSLPESPPRIVKINGLEVFAIPEWFAGYFSVFQDQTVKKAIPAILSGLHGLWDAFDKKNFERIRFSEALSLERLSEMSEEYQLNALYHVALQFLFMLSHQDYGASIAIEGCEGLGSECEWEDEYKEPDEGSDDEGSDDEGSDDDGENDGRESDEEYGSDDDDIDSYG